MPGPPVLTRQFHDRQIDHGYPVTLIVEPYKITGLQGDINRIVLPPVPQRGTVHPLGSQFDNAILDRVRLVEWISKDAAIIALIYRADQRFRGGPRPLVDAYGREDDIELPVWRRLTQSDAQAGTQFSYYAYAIPPVVAKRVTIYRTEVRFVGGNQVTAVQDAISINVGARYTIGTQTYLLSGHSSASYDGLAYTRVNYRFYTTGPFPAIPIDNPEVGNSVAIPALPAMHTWSTRLDPDDRSRPPIIRAVPIATLAQQGGQLPGFP